jgi:hypothetical protein
MGTKFTILLLASFAGANIAAAGALAAAGHPLFGVPCLLVGVLMLAAGARRLDQLVRVVEIAYDGGWYEEEDGGGLFVDPDGLFGWMARR